MRGWTSGRRSSMRTAARRAGGAGFFCGGFVGGAGGAVFPGTVAGKRPPPPPGPGRQRPALHRRSRRTAAVRPGRRRANAGGFGPVSMDRKILGPSILNFDTRGSEYLDDLNSLLPKEWLYDISGNTLGNHFSLTKLKWIKENQPEIYQETDKLLPWVSFVSFMLGADPIVDYSLANRTLLFDINHESWSEEIIDLSNLDLWLYRRLFYLFRFFQVGNCLYLDFWINGFF